MTKPTPLQEYVWTTKDGRQIPFSELTHTHLDRCIAMVERQRRAILANQTGRPSWDLIDNEPALVLFTLAEDLKLAHNSQLLRTLRAERGRRSVVRRSLPRSKSLPPVSEEANELGF